VVDRYAFKISVFVKRCYFRFWRGSGRFIDGVANCPAFLHMSERAPRHQAEQALHVNRQFRIGEGSFTRFFNFLITPAQRRTVQKKDRIANAGKRSFS
jgi:hypothetical protein